MKTRREFLKISAATVATAPALNAGAFSFSHLNKKQPNLLFIFTDQQLQVSVLLCGTVNTSAKILSCFSIRLPGCFECALD